MMPPESAERAVLHKAQKSAEEHTRQLRIASGGERRAQALLPEGAERATQARHTVQRDAILMCCNTVHHMVP